MWDYLNRSWFAGYVLGLAISTGTIFLLVFHLVLAIPVANLIEPFLVFALILLPMTRGIYWAQPLAKGGNFGPLSLVVALYVATFFALCVFFGTRLGFFVAGEQTRNYVFALAAGFGTGGLLYVLRKKNSPRK